MVEFGGNSFFSNYKLSYFIILLILPTLILKGYISNYVIISFEIPSIPPSIKKKKKYRNLLPSEPKLREFSFFVSAMNLKRKAIAVGNGEQGSEKERQIKSLDLGNGSQVEYMPRFLSFKESSKFLDYLDAHIPWTRPTLRVFGRSCLQVSLFHLSLN